MSTLEERISLLEQKFVALIASFSTQENASELPLSNFQET